MDYLPVRINTLRPDVKLGFNLYIKVGDRFVHYIHESDSLEANRLDILRKKGLKKFFILTESENSYLSYLDAGLDSLKSSGKSTEEKASLANDSMVTAAENAERSLESKEAFENTQKQFDKVTDFLVSDKGAIKGILSAAGVAGDAFQHSATVSSLSLAVATRLEIKDAKELFELGIASLLHDIGKTRFKFDPMKPRDLLTPEEKKIYLQHPADGVAMLSGKEFISPRVLGLVADHEEIGAGRGFPEKKNIEKLQKPYQILNLCNDFERYCHEKGIPPMKAIDSFFEDRGELFPGDLIGILATVLT